MRGRVMNGLSFGRPIGIHNRNYSASLASTNGDASYDAMWSSKSFHSLRIQPDDVLGEGKFGVVRRGTLVDSGQEVAVKTIPKLIGEKALLEAMQEVRSIYLPWTIVLIDFVCVGKGVTIGSSLS